MRPLALLLVCAGCFTYTGGDDGGGDAPDGGGCPAVCSGALPRCDPMTGQCVACLPDNDNCPSGKRCRQGADGSWACGAECVVQPDCASGKFCCRGACVDLQGDVKNCGACGQVCPPVANGASQCMGGACAANCKSGFADCNASLRDGCETNLETDVAHCGACGNACTVAHGNASCNAGACAVAGCDFGWGDCDASYANGCETDLQSTPAHCGGCATTCPSYAHASAQCTLGACQLGPCAAGFADCNLAAGDGCEVDLSSDAANCGQCGASCSVLNAVGACKASACAITCNAGFGDCDKLVADGCEIDLTTDPSNCGACGKRCVAYPNASAICSKGNCGFGGCYFGFADCNNNLPLDGCEKNVTADVANCGGCGKVCAAPPHATAGCALGACGVGACIGLYGDCDGLPADGCEQPLAADPANCGACGNACPNPPNGTPSCVNGQCGLAGCNAGFGNCNGDPADGCEADFSSDNANCGKCGVACGNGLVCKMGQCAVGPIRQLNGTQNTGFARGNIQNGIAADPTNNKIYWSPGYGDNGNQVVQEYADLGSFINDVNPRKIVLTVPYENTYHAALNGYYYYNQYGRR